MLGDHSKDQSPVAVIGAGSSGIAMCKALHDRGVDFHCYEKSDRVGGNWVFRNRNGISAVYRSMHLNSSKERTQFLDFPMPKDYPLFPSHEQTAKYCDDYVDKFAFREKIRFETGVQKIEPMANGHWSLKTEEGDVQEYRAVCIATGKHWDPAWPNPEYPGNYTGTCFHAHDYIDVSEPYDLRGKRVLVVGAGNSAMDIASEVSRPGNCSTTALSMRRGRWILPKLLGGRPIDDFVPHPIHGKRLHEKILPARLQSILIRRRLEKAVGKPEFFGMQPARKFRPGHVLDFAVISMSQDIFMQIAYGDLQIRPDIARLDDKTVSFVDGTSDEYDFIIYCTGYKQSFSYFEENVVSSQKDKLLLWSHVCLPGTEGLYFVGYVTPIGPLMPVAEAQSQYIAQLLSGERRRPNADVMRAEMDRTGKRRNPLAAPCGPVIVHEYIKYLNKLGSSSSNTKT